MRTRLYVTSAPWLVLALSAAAVAIARPAGSEALRRGLAPTLALSALGAIASWIASRDGHGRPVRLAMTFVLAAFAVLPAIEAMAVLLASLAGGAGGGVAGPSRRGLRPAASVAAGAAAALLLLPASRPDAASRPLATLLALLALFGLAQMIAFIAAALLDGRTAQCLSAGLERSFRQALLESVNVPLALALAALLGARAQLAALALAAAVLLGEIGTKALDRALADLRATNDLLAARLSELATLHAIGREMLSSLDPARVFSVIERECVKILDVDSLVVALSDADTSEMHTAHLWLRGGAPAEPPAGPPDGLVEWVALEKRPLRVDDLHDGTTPFPFRASAIPADARSVLAVPLVVEERVTGVLSVRSARPRAYDEHQLSVLTTIAQQAAVALENARHYEMATVDSLTRLFLRDYFERRLAEEHHRARRYGGSFAVLMMDLDGFKEINDRYGHLQGDRYLRALGLAIRSRLRSADLACRYGGDEFCLLLPETDLDGARIIAERLRKTVSRLRVEVEGESLRTTASIGVAVFPQHDSGDLRGLLLCADQALYQAKRAGRDRVAPYAA